MWTQRGIRGTFYMKKNLYITQGKIMIAIEKHDNIYSLNILLSHLYVRHMLRMKIWCSQQKKKSKFESNINYFYWKIWKLIISNTVSVKI